MAESAHKNKLVEWYGRVRSAVRIDRRSRPQRWRDTVSELLALQAAYGDWLTALPDSLRASPTAAALEAIVDLDIASLAECEPPRLGFGVILVAQFVHRLGLTLGLLVGCRV